MLYLTNTGIVQCCPLGSRTVCCMSGCVYFALFSNFLLCVLCLTNIGLVRCFSLRLPSSLHPCVYLCFIQFAFVMWLCPTSSGLCSDFCPAPLVFARLIFCFVLFSFKFVFCVLSLTNLIFLRFPVKLAHHFCNLVRVFRHAASSSAGFLPCFPSSFFLFFNLCVLFVPRLFCAVISYVFLPALPW